MALTDITSTTARLSTSGHAGAEQVWSSKTLFWMYKSMWMQRLLGTVVREENELQGAAGDVETIQIVAPLIGAGKTDSSQRGDGGEAMVFFSDTVTLHANKHECGYMSTLTQQKTKINLRNKSKEALGQWAAQILDSKFINVASGIVTDDALCAANTPSTNRAWFGGQTTAGVVTNRGTDALIVSTDLMGPEVLSLIKRKAEVCSGQSYPKIQPIKWEGKDLYICIMHPYQLRDFRSCASFLSKAYYVDAKEWKNPLTSGAEFIWDGVICYSWDKILTRLGAGGSTLGTESFITADPFASGVYGGRALFMGKDAVALAWGKQKMRWSEYDYPHGDGWSAGVEMVQGFKKIEFGASSIDFGVITIDTACYPDA